MAVAKKAKKEKAPKEQTKQMLQTFGIKEEDTEISLKAAMNSSPEG